MSSGPAYSERERLWILGRYDLLDTPAEERFDDIVRDAAERFETPIALFSLIDKDRQWFKARVGLDIPQADRKDSFCEHVVAINAPLVVEDTSKDAQFAENPFVTGCPNIAFYAGAPVRAANGYPLGTLCVIDHSPRPFPWQDFLALQEFAKRLESCLEERQAETSAAD